MKRTFGAYLKAALELALRNEYEGEDDGNLQCIHERCRRGVQTNWIALTREQFLAEYLWCVGSIRKKYPVHLRHYPKQMKLFHQCKAARIVADADAIRASWTNDRCDLNKRMFDAVMAMSADLAQGWNAFKRDCLLLPSNPETDSMDDWLVAFTALDHLPMVGPAIAWYLIRNLYGGPFFKPDLHINAIVKHFFGEGKLDAMAAAVWRLWPQACSDKRFQQVHLGEVDYMLWWYRRATNKPPN
jgi:hypothetical protein